MYVPYLLQYIKWIENVNIIALKCHPNIKLQEISWYVQLILSIGKI